MTGVNDGRVDDDGACRIFMESSQECPNEAVYVQDDYEVKNSMYEGPVVFTEGVGNFYDSSVVEMYQPISWSVLGRQILPILKKTTLETGTNKSWIARVRPQFSLKIL